MFFVFATSFIGRGVITRFDVNVRTVWHAEPMIREKLRGACGILGILDESGILKVDSFTHAYVEGLSFSDYFSPYGFGISDRYAFEGFKRVDLGRLFDFLSKGLDRMFRGKMRFVSRGLVLTFSFVGYFFDIPAVCNVMVRGSGVERRSFGDIEVACYNLDLGVDDLAGFLRYLLRENEDKGVSKRLFEFSTKILHTDFGRMTVKNFLIQDIDADMRTDFGRSFLVSNRDIRSHVALVVRYLIKRRRALRNYLGRSSSLPEGFIPEEKEVYERISTFLNVSTIYNKLAGDEFKEGIIRAYKSAEYAVSTGSLIVMPASSDHENMRDGYFALVREVLHPLVQKFPTLSEFEGWLREGIMQLGKRGAKEVF